MDGLKKASPEELALLKKEHKRQLKDDPTDENDLFDILAERMRQIGSKAGKGKGKKPEDTTTLQHQEDAGTPQQVYNEWARQRAYHPDEYPTGSEWFNGAELALMVSELKTPALIEKLLSRVYYDKKHYQETGELILSQERHLTPQERQRFWEQRDPLSGKMLTPRDNQQVWFRVSVYVTPLERNNDYDEQELPTTGQEAGSVQAS